MTKSGWQIFEGSHYELGRQLGEYWCHRLHEFRRKSDGEFIQRMLERPCRRKGQENLELSLRRAFPDLAQEIDGMVEGAKEARFEKASFRGIFRIALGEVAYANGCSSIAAAADHMNFLGHNEEEESIVPLCYAKVRLHLGRTTREFLSISYPFQLFGSAVGANANIAFTGNSIGIQGQRWHLVETSLRRRVPKTVFTRLMLECQSIAAVTRTLRSYHAMLPSHWYVASKSKIVSLQMRPRARFSAKQIQSSRVTRISCHTNHFQSGDTDGWSSSTLETKESERRLRRLSKLAEHLGPVQSQPDVSPTRLEEALKLLRGQTRQGEKTTLATIVLAVDKNGSVIKAFDYFSGMSVGIERVGDI